MAFEGLVRGEQFLLAVEDAPAARSLVGLLRLERAEIEAVLGTTVALGRRSDRAHQRWDVEIDARAPAVRLEWRPAARRLVSVLPTADDFGRSVDLLHSLAHADADVVADTPCASPQEAFERIRSEIANVYPAFELRGIDWDEVTARHAHVRDLEGDAFVLAAQEWVAELGDAHTHLYRPGPVHHPPYVADLTPDGARLREVPPSSAAAAASVAAGWVLEVDDPAGWLRRTGATPQHRAAVAARRALAMRAPTRTFSARSPSGRRVSWVEERRPRPAVQPRPDGVRLTTFTPGTPEEVDRVLARLDRHGTVTVDLRGNPGGSLEAAVALRSRFLHEHTQIGWVRFSDGRGRLADRAAVHASPHAEPWPGRLRVLVDDVTYSASEDFVHGLQGLDHVEVRGRTTGGGSGRPHTRRILDDLDLSVSTALTYDREGRCIERNGIRPDVDLEADDDPVGVA